jgi:hypothetical protein
MVAVILQKEGDVEHRLYICVRGEGRYRIHSETFDLLE